MPRHDLHRWHGLDPVRFKHGLRATILALGWRPSGECEPLTEDIALVGGWHQAEPHASLSELPPIHERWSR